MCDTCTEFSLTIQTGEVHNSKRTRSEQTQQSRKGRVRHEWGQDFGCPCENFARKMNPPSWEGLRRSGQSRERLLILGEHQRGWISYPNGFPVTKDSLGLLLLAYFLWFFLVCRGFFGMGGEFCFFFFTEAKKKEKSSEVCWRKLPGFDNKDASTAQFRLWIHPVTHMINQKYH